MKRQRSRNPPARLSWPVPLSLKNDENTKNTSSSKNNHQSYRNGNSISPSYYESTSFINELKRKHSEMNGSSSSVLSTLNNTNGSIEQTVNSSKYSKPTYYSSSAYASRRRKTSIPKLSSSSSSVPESSCTELWTDKCANLLDIEKLCVQKRKAQEVKSWVESALSPLNMNNNDISQKNSKTLLLVGSPGVGKR